MGRGGVIKPTKIRKPIVGFHKITVHGTRECVHADHTVLDWLGHVSAVKHTHRPHVQVQCICVTLP